MKVLILSNLMDAHQKQQHNDNIDYIYYSAKQGCDMWGKCAFSSIWQAGIFIRHYHAENKALFV